MAPLESSLLPSATLSSRAAETMPAQLEAATGSPPSTTSQVTSTSTPTSTSGVVNAVSTSSKGLSTGAKAGIAVSVTIVGLSVIGLLIFLFIKQMRHRKHILRLQALRRESERGMRNAAAFQSALPPAFLENEDPNAPPKPPPKPPKAPMQVVKAPSKRGLSWMNEKEVVTDWRSNMGRRFSIWREKQSVGELDSPLIKAGYSSDSSDGWV